MKQRLWLPIVAAMVILVQVAAVQAKEAKPDVKANTKDEFAAVADHVRQQMAPGGRFESVGKGDQDTVNRDLSDMQGLYDKFGTVDAMDQASKVQLYNHQSEVNAILTHNDADREICEQVQPMGSHIPKTVCKTKRQLQEEEGMTQRYLQDSKQQQNPVGGH
ncbi:hypothetical protein DVT68_07755 [Dyella solisilvae]|uniref:DUF4168 domain-containing protein n=1 Tax=Dyella solisilvae TaxID=1920168 RepID=A0A370K7J8_9GAMM|nr:hypothetical protein [Dyella solisilvae]RDI98427.1 hypothetical protein DVT68_07755 [Dyella solisilvae]